MKARAEFWTLVIAGRWNKYILAPSWIAENIFEEKNVLVEFPLNFQGPPRYTDSLKKIRIIPDNGRVIFVALDTKNENLIRIEKIAYKLLDLLPHTPINSFGVNFGFVETENTKIIELFDFKDNKKFGDAGYLIDSNLIKRSIKKFDNVVLNFSLENKGKEIIFDFNFHHQVKDAKEAKEKVSNSLVENLSRAESILKEIYGLEYNSSGEGPQDVK